MAAKVVHRALVAIVVAACGSINKPMLVPGYTASGVAARAEPLPQVPAATGGEATSKVTKVWGHVQDVSSWSELFRGPTQGHVFAGSQNTTVSTRVSQPELSSVLNGSVEWAAFAPGATVSQLIYAASDPNRWVAAYVIERTDAASVATHDNVDDVSFFVVTPDGRIDASAHVLCASCHQQMGDHAR